MFIESEDLIILYLLVELQSLGSYVLTAMNRNNRLSIEAGIKYFILGSLSSIILVLGLSLIYGFSGTINIHDFSMYIVTMPETDDVVLVYYLVFSVFLIMVGFLFKIYAAPFHF